MADSKFETYEDRGGKWRWRLKGGNGQTIASSGESFANKGNADRAVKRVKEQAGKAKLPAKAAARGSRSTAAKPTAKANRAATRPAAKAKPAAKRPAAKRTTASSSGRKRPGATGKK